jgi:small subunit ribosomal protein S5
MKRQAKPKMDKVAMEAARREAHLEKWIPKTEIGKKVKSGEIKDIDQILNSGQRILESEIIDTLIPNLEYELIAIGQSKGKFGGGKRSIWKQTQKKTKEGNKPKFATIAVVGNRNGYIGLGHGKAKETVPAREKAIRNAKLNLMKVRRGCGSWACACGESHSIPIKVSGKSSSVQVQLIPAPKGTNLTVQKELRKILSLAGFKDIYSKTKGKTNTSINLVSACEKALKQLNLIKLNKDFIKESGLQEGRINE